MVNLANHNRATTEPLIAPSPGRFPMRPKPHKQNPSPSPHKHKATTTRTTEKLRTLANDLRKPATDKLRTLANDLRFAIAKLRAYYASQPPPAARTAPQSQNPAPSPPTPQNAANLTPTQEPADLLTPVQAAVEAAAVLGIPKRAAQPLATRAQAAGHNTEAEILAYVLRSWKN